MDRWTFESNPPSWYRSVGLARADFAQAIGQTVTVEALRRRDGSLFGYMRKITLPDRTSLELIARGSQVAEREHDARIPSPRRVRDPDASVALAQQASSGPRRVLPRRIRT